MGQSTILKSIRISTKMKILFILACLFQMGFQKPQIPKHIAGHDYASELNENIQDYRNSVQDYGLGSIFRSILKVVPKIIPKTIPKKIPEAFIEGAVNEGINHAFGQDYRRGNGGRRPGRKPGRKSRGKPAGKPKS